MPIYAQNKKISELRALLNPTNNAVFPLSQDDITYKLSLVELGHFLSTKTWVYNENKTIESTETIVIQGDYVLENSNLTLMSGDTQISVGSLVFNKQAQVFIGGNLLLSNSTIINDGLISVGGGLIFLGDSNITGNGIII
jgi:hypothetical protein